MDYKLTYICPSIRTEKLLGLYESISKSFSDSWELILISPYDLPKELKEKPNVKLIKDWGNPVRCQQLGLIVARGEYITRAVDDGIYAAGGIDRAFTKMEDNAAVILKHTEFNPSIDTNHKDFQDMTKPEFFELSYHIQTLKRYVPYHYKIMNFGLIKTELLKKVGGWDCQFETIALAELDLSIRLQFYGIKMILSDDLVIKCEWMPGEEGDHAPMHYGFFDDNRIYEKIYNEPTCEDRLIIDLDNWAMAPDKWERRFK